MEKSKILALGLGGCGNAQLSEFLELDKRYTGIFMNTNMSEMENLKHFDKDRRCFYVPNADGCGADRNLSEAYIKEEAPKFAEMIKKFTQQDTILMFASMDGGTGSKAMTMMALMIKKICPEKSINLIPTIPSLDATIVSFDNTMDTWNEIVDLKKHKIIDSIMFIDNNKKEDEKEINRLAMKELDLGISISENNVDTKDSLRAHTCLGYKVILNLDNSIDDLLKSVDFAIAKSMFYVPEKLECNILVGKINNKFSKKEIEDEFQGYDFRKINTIDSNSKDKIKNMLILGGCDMPREAIDLIKEAKKDIEKRKNSRLSEDIDDLKIRTVKKEKFEKFEQTNSKMESDEINDLFNDDDFWNL